MLNRITFAIPYAATAAVVAYLSLQIEPPQPVPVHKPSTASQQEIDASSRTPLGMVVNWARTLRANQHRPDSLIWERLMASSDGSVVCIAFAVRDEADMLVSRRVAFHSGKPGGRSTDWEENCNSGVEVVADAERWITAQ